jgi:hypothetical protein
MRRRPKRARRGFALVMTLVLVALAVATLARIASRGVALVLEARTRSERLQAEWAALSCRLVVLENAERLFGDSDAVAEAAGVGWPYPSERYGAFRIGKVMHHFLLADEQAKLNLNTVYELEPTTLAGILAEAQHAATAPLRRDAAAPVRPLGAEGRPYDSWGRVVDLARLSTAEAGAESLVAITRQFSIVEEGRLNVRRATDDSLRRTAQLVLTAAETEKLVEARKGFAGDLRDWLAAVDIPSHRLVPLRRLLADRSSAYTLWVWSESERGVTMSSVGETRGQTQPRTLQWP